MKNNEYGIISLLLKLSTVDTNIDQKELAFIKEVGLRIGLNDEDLRLIIDNPDNYLLKVPDTEQERMSIFYYLLFLMKIDRKAVESESQMVRQLGVSLGFRDSMVDEMVHLIIEHENKLIPPLALLEKIIKYSN